MTSDSKLGSMAKLLRLIAVGGLLTLSFMVQAEQRHTAANVHKTSPYHQTKLTERAKEYYQAVWGVDNLKVSQTASGNLIRFSYRVTEPALAKALGDNKATPRMYGLRSRAMLEVPVMDKIGQLRQTNTVEIGKEYWMVFSNKGNIVKSGDRVSVLIGSFHADGLMVE